MKTHADDDEDDDGDGCLGADKHDGTKNPPRVIQVLNRNSVYIVHVPTASCYV